MMARKYMKTYQAAYLETERLLHLVQSELADFPAQDADPLEAEYAEVIVLVEVAKRLGDIARFLEAGQ